MVTIHKKKELLLEIIRYGFWGCMTVLFSMVSYTLLTIVFDYKIANFISIVITKIFAYFTNKKFVFKTRTTFVEQLREIGKFVIARSFTGIIDWIGQILLVEVFLQNDFIAKCSMIIVTTILNYFLGKFSVFKKRKNK